MGAFLFVRRNVDISSSKNIEDISYENTNQNLSFDDLIESVRENASKDLKETKIENNPYHDSKVYIADTEDEYTEIWLVDKSNVQDTTSVYDEIRNRAQNIKFEKYQNEEEIVFDHPENIIVKQEAGKVIAIISNKADAIENSINSYISQNTMNVAISNTGNIEVGDYVAYTSEKNENVAWRIWSIDEANNKVVIIPTEPLGKLSFYGINGDATRAGWVDAETKIEELCDEYKNEKLGITAGDIRSITYEDIKAVVNKTFYETDSVFTFEEGTFYEYLKNPTDSENTISQTPIVATPENPVSVKIKWISGLFNFDWKELSNQKSSLAKQTFGDFFGSYSWIANKMGSFANGAVEDLEVHNGMDYPDYYEIYGDRISLDISVLKVNSVYYHDSYSAFYPYKEEIEDYVRLYGSLGENVFGNGPRETPEYGVRPLVTVDVTKLVANSSGAVSGTESNPWKIRDLAAEANYQDNFGTYYITLAEAFDNAPSGSTITTLRDVEESKQATLVANKTIVLDLNGKTISRKELRGSPTNLVSFIDSNGNLTIKDSKSNGKINLVSAEHSCIVYSSGMFTMESGTLESEALGLWTEGADEVIIKGGTIESKTGAAVVIESGTREVIIEGGTIIGSYALRTSADKVTIKGGTIESYYLAVNIKSGTGEVIIEDGTIIAEESWGLHVSGGKITIKGGTIESKTNTAVIISNDTAATIEGGTITSKTNGITHEASADLIVNDGTITGIDSRGIQSSGGGNIIINGGKIEGGTTAIIKSGGSTGNIIVNSGTIIGGPKASNSDGKGIHMNGTGSITINGGNITSCNDAVSVVKTGKNLTITGGKMRVRYDPSYSTGVNASRRRRR